MSPVPPGKVAFIVNCELEFTVTATGTGLVGVTPTPANLVELGITHSILLGVGESTIGTFIVGFALGIVPKKTIYPPGRKDW